MQTHRRSTPRGDPRDAVLFVRLTAREHQTLVCAATKKGLNLSSFSRLVLLEWLAADANLIDPGQITRFRKMTKREAALAAR